MSLFIFPCYFKSYSINRWLKVATVQFITDDAINALQLKNPNLKIVTTNFVNDDDGKPLDRIELV